MDLTTHYLGMALRNPLVASASPLSVRVDGVKELADAGVGAVVLYSLFEEEVHREQLRDLHLTEAHEDAFGEALSYFPAPRMAEPGAGHRYLTHVQRCVRGRRRARHRQPQRQHLGWLGALRPGDRGRRRRGHRAQHLRRAG